MNARLTVPTAIIAWTTIGFLLMVSRDWAQNNELNVQVHGFDDARGVTVLSPSVDLAQDYTDRTSLRLNYGLDAIRPRPTRVSAVTAMGSTATVRWSGSP